MSGHKIQMLSQNQDSGTGHYVTMKSYTKNGEEIFNVTADAGGDDPKSK